MSVRSYPGPETIHRYVLDNGITVLLYENMSSNTVSVAGVIRAGAVVEPAAQAGLADFTADLLIRGSSRWTFEASAEALESVGAGVGFGGSRHTTSFSAHSLVEDLDLVLDIAADALLRPLFPADQVERVRGQTITGLQMRANDTGDMARLAFYEAAYPGHPYSRSINGYEETVIGLSRDHLADFHARFYGPRDTIIGLAGAIRAEEALAKLNRTFGGWRNDAQEVVPLVGDAARPIGLSRRVMAMPDKHQVDVRLGLPGPRRAAPDYLNASLMNTILGVFGMMGRIGHNVREEHGLAYYASSRLNGGLGPGPWVASAGVAPDKVEQAIEAIRHEIRRIQDEPVTAEELADSQAYRTGSLPMSLETNSGLVDIITDMELYNLGLDYLQTYTARMLAITPADIMAAARRYLSADDLVIAVAGPVEAQ